MTPVPARFYPAGGEAHGHPASLEWQAGHLLVAPEDSPAWRVAAGDLRVEARGFNHSQWALTWTDAHGQAQLLILDDTQAGPLYAAAPQLFASGLRIRQGSQRRFGVGIALLILLPLILIVGLFMAVEPLSEQVVEHIPPEVEAQIGAAVLARTRAEGPLIESGPAFDALQVIARRLSRPDEKLHFHLAERKEINAFAAPGGVVVVNSALMKSATSAEEVAGVLAHEIAHLELRHSLKQLVKSAGLRVIAAALLGDYGSVGNWATQLTELKFSRDAEREADARGLERLAEARIDPAGMVRFFESLARTETATLPGMFSTHPATTERLEALRQNLTQHPPGRIEAITVDWPAVQASLGLR